MHLFAHSEGALDFAKLFFMRGYLLGAVAGPGWRFGDALAPSSMDTVDLRARLSDRIARTARLIGCGTAMVADSGEVLLANSRQATRQQSDALKGRTEPWECTMQASYDRQLAMT